MNRINTKKILKKAETHTSTFMINTLHNLHCYLYKMIHRK